MNDVELEKLDNLIEGAGHDAHGKYWNEEDYKYLFDPLFPKTKPNEYLVGIVFDISRTVTKAIISQLIQAGVLSVNLSQLDDPYGAVPHDP